jgi:hypothetical protein
MRIREDQTDPGSFEFPQYPGALSTKAPDEAEILDFFSVLQKNG